MLSNYSPWQIDKVVSASLLELDLLSTEQIVEYADNLLLTGYYDDALLEILEDDPIYPSVAKSITFRTAIINLGFPIVSKEYAYWILIYKYIYGISVRPHNFNILETENLYGFLFFEDVFDFEPVEDIEVFKHLLYQIEDAMPLPDGYIQIGFNDPKTLFEIKSKFFELCEQWLINNMPKIDAIFREIYI